MTTTPKRGYDNSRRAAAAAETRDEILRAALEMLAETGSWSVPAIAARVGASVPTVYRHFPNKQALRDGLQDYSNERMKPPPFPDTLEATPELIAEVFAFFARNEALILSLRGSDFGAEKRRRIRARWRPLVETAMPNANDGEVQRAILAITSVGGFAMYRHLTADRGLSVEEAAEVARFIGQSVVDRITSSGSSDAQR